MDVGQRAGKGRVQEGSVRAGASQHAVFMISPRLSLTLTPEEPPWLLDPIPLPAALSHSPSSSRAGDDHPAVFTFLFEI